MEKPKVLLKKCSKCYVRACRKTSIIAIFRTFLQITLKRKNRGFDVLYIYTVQKQINEDRGKADEVLTISITPVSTDHQFYLRKGKFVRLLFVFKNSHIGEVCLKV
jgi:hypothetical protein